MGDRQDALQKDRSLNLAKIIENGVRIGKCTTQLRHKANDSIADDCCFMVATRGFRLNLSSPTADRIQVVKFVAYLTGLKRHFDSQIEEQVADAVPAVEEQQESADEDDEKADRVIGASVLDTEEETGQDMHVMSGFV